MDDARRKLISGLAREVSDQRVLDALAAVPRHRFVTPSIRPAAYEDVALPIAAGQTISQPTIVGLMVQALELRRFDRVLEIGTGSGYQAAVLAELVREVVSVERIPELAESAKALLRTLGYANVHIRPARDTLGYPDQAPYDAIVVSAAAPRLPRTLVDQLGVGGRLVVPVGSLREQTLMKLTKTSDSFSIQSLGACRFVPLIGPDGWSEDEL